jgi:hypothetical protein
MHSPADNPYLVQLVGFHLVRFYNNEVFENQRPRDPRVSLPK